MSQQFGPGQLAKFLIIGSGMAAAALLLHLASRRVVEPRDLGLVGTGPLGRGAAYGARHPQFRLNVRAGLMRLWSAGEPPPGFVDEDGFEKWASEHLHDPDAATQVGMFYARRDFARWLDGLLARLPGLDEISRTDGQVTALKRTANGWRAELANGAALEAEQVLLATGNPPASTGFADEMLRDHPQLVANPWRGDWLASLPLTGRVTIAGGGLTALDAIYALKMRGHQGAIRLVVPRPILPPPQASWTEDAASPDWPEPARPAGLIRFIRRYIADEAGTAGWQEAGWQQAFENLRAGLSLHWQGLSAGDRTRLMKRLGWLWSLARYRAAPQTIEAAADLMAAGQLQMITARLTRAEPAGRAISCHLAGPHSRQKLETDWLINCTGPGRDPLLDQLVGDQLAVRDGLGRSVGVGPDFCVQRPAAGAWPDLFMIGPPTAGSLGDVVGAFSTARQAESLARRLAERPG